MNNVPPTPPPPPAGQQWQQTPEAYPSAPGGYAQPGADYSQAPGGYVQPTADYSQAPGGYAQPTADYSQPPGAAPQAPVLPTYPGHPRPPAARVESLTKVYGSGDTQVVALDGVNVEFASGEFTAIMGRSGSGKSTLMHCAAGLDSVTSGRVFLGDLDLTTLSERKLTLARRDRIGFIFQSFNLVPTLTAKENIELPLSIAGRKVDRDWFNTVIATVGLGDRLGHRPAEMSGGQQQRVACARALVSRPEVIFADEPTGNLDSNSGAEVLRFLRDTVHQHQQTVVMVTHDPGAASWTDRVIFLADGRVVDEMRNPTPEAVLATMGRIESSAGLMQ